MDNTTGLCHGHAPGGVAIMWRSSLDKYVTPLYFNINWLTGIRIQQGNQIFVILCVYMPYECRDNEESYLDNLGTIKTIIDELDCTCISETGTLILVTGPLCLAIMSDCFALKII